VTSVGENDKKANTIQPPFLCFSHLQETIGNSSISINDVWFVDGLRYNIFSISQFFYSGYEVMFDKNKCTVINKIDESLKLKMD